MEETASRLSALAERLRHARMRVRIAILARAAAWSLAASLMVFIGLEIPRRRMPGVLAEWTGTPLLWAGAVLVAGLVAGVVLMAIRTPDVAALARRADRRFGLEESVSTAFDVERRGRHGASDDLLAQALLSRAASRADRIDPRVLAPFRLSWETLAVALLALAALAVVTLVPEVRVPQADAPASVVAEPLGEAERIELADDIERVAALVSEQAEARDDAYMEAVARTLEGLGARVSGDPATSRTGIVEELEALEAYAASAASDWRGSVGERIPDLLGALSDTARTPPAPPVGETPELPPNLMNETASGAGDAGMTPAESDAPAGEAGDDTSALDAMLSDMEETARGTGRAPGEGGDAPVSVSANYEQIAEAQNAARQQQMAQRPDGAQLIGPSANARAGDSILAGEGTDAVDGGAAEAVELEFETSAELTLEANDSGEGRRIEMEIAPSAELTEVTEESLATGAAGWRRQTEAEVERSFVSVEDREAVSAYRLGMTGQAEQ